MAAGAPLVLDHVLNPDHDVLSHSAVFSGSEGNVFCIHCASERFNSVPDLRRLALLDGVRSILSAHPEASHCNGGIDACLPMLLHGIDSADAGVVQAATDIMLTLKGELDDPVGILTSLVSRTVSLGLPRASGHLYLIGQLLTDASHDRVLATTLGNACFGRRCGDHAHRQALGICGGNDVGVSLSSGGAGDGLTGSSVEEERFGGFGPFLAAHALSASCPDHVKSDVLFVAMELLDCCTTACMDAAVTLQDPSVPPPGSDPFVSVMLAVPKMLARRSSCDEPLQLHSIAYLATAAGYCCQRAEMGMTGWSSNPAGVPDVLVALFDGAREFAPREMVPGGGGGRSAQSSSGGLCSTLKTLLMSPSYRVRSATARLIASLCNDHRFSEEPAAAHENAATGRGGRNGACLFFRETMVAAGATDFLFEAIKSEREGTPRQYLEAAEALALSPVEFFHANNFSMKFVAPVLLGAARGGGGGGGGSIIAFAEAPCGRAGLDIDRDDEAAVFALSSRLLLQALVTVPSSGGVVEELLATAAVSTQSHTPNKTRALGLAADVLSLIASGDISISKDRKSFMDAVEVLLYHLEEYVVWAAGSDSQQEYTSTTAASSSIGSAGQPRVGTWPNHLERCEYGGLILQCARVYESLLHTAGEWISLQGSPPGGPSFQGISRGYRDEEGIALADLVFGSYERTLSCQCSLVARSKHLAHDIAFLSCIGAAIDASLAVLFHNWRREQAATNSSRSIICKAGTAESSQFLLVRPSFVSAQELDLTSVEFSRDGGPGGHDGGDDGDGDGVQERLLAYDEVSTPASCLQTILEVAVEADLVSWMLDLYVRCGWGTSGGGAKTHSSQTFEGSSDGDGACGATTRELLVEVLQSFLHAQGWVNGLCANGADRPPHNEEGGSGGGVMSGALNSAFGQTVRSVVQSWTASVVSGNEEKVPSPLDQYAISLLGTTADNGDLCKLAALLVSLSPSFLGVLHPHTECRVDCAVTLLRYVKTLPEAVFCLNMFAHIAQTGDDQTGGGCGSGGRLSDLSKELSTAVKDVLARFPVEEIVLSVIPLSTTALSFSIMAGCEAFIADWLVAAPLARIKRGLTGFGAFHGTQLAAADGADDLAATEGFDRNALTGVLGAAVSRWRAEFGDDLQHHSQSDAVIYRLACVLLMSPDTFFSLAFDQDLQSNGPVDDEKRGRQRLAEALCNIIPGTLESLSSALSPVVSRQGDRGNGNYRTSKLMCTSQVCQLASAFLCARCKQGCYTPAGCDVHPNSASFSWPESPEIPLAHACVGLLQGMLGPRRGHGSSGDGNNHIKALLAVLNLLNALLVLVGGDSELLQQPKQGLALALQESHAVISEVLAPTAVAITRLTDWLDHTPDMLAAFLQVCVIWNAVDSARNGFGDDRSRSYHCVPIQVLEDILSSGGSGPCVIVGEGGDISSNCTMWSKTKEPLGAPQRRGVHRSLLQVLAVRCVESAARTRFFSRLEVLALQLTLQGIVCDGSATLASAALGALQALWEAYAGVMQSAELVGQSWNPFTVECSLENALRSLSCDRESEADLLRSGDDPKEIRVDAPVLASTIGKLLRSAGKEFPRLSSSEILDGGSSVGVLSATAVVSIYQCATLLATNLSAAFGDGMDQREEPSQSARGMGGDSSCFLDCRDEGVGSDDAKFHLSDALVQLVRVLMCSETPSLQSPIVGEGPTREVVDALLTLHSALLRGREHENEAGPWLEQVSMPLSSGAFHACPANLCNLSAYEGVFFVKFDNWRSLSSASEPSSLAELAREVLRLVERLSGRPRAGSRMEEGQGRGVHYEQSPDHVAST